MTTCVAPRQRRAARTEGEKGKHRHPKGGEDKAPKEKGETVKRSRREGTTIPKKGWRQKHLPKGRWRCVPPSFVKLVRFFLSPSRIAAFPSSPFGVMAPSPPPPPAFSVVVLSPFRQWCFLPSFTMVGGNVLQPSVVWCRCPSSFWVVMYICFASLNMVIELNLIMFLHLFFSWRGTSITTEKWREEGRIDQKKKGTAHER